MSEFCLHISTLRLQERLSRLMGGRMWVESELGQGSTFHFTFQTTLMDDPDADKHELAKRVQSLKSKKCLIIDDNAITCQILKQDFEAWGLITTICSSATEALELLRGNHYDIAIVDAVLGDSQNSGGTGELDGVELVRQLRKQEGKLLESSSRNTEVVLLKPVTTQISKKLDDLNIRAIHPKPWKRSRLWSTLYDIFPSTGDRRQGNQPRERSRLTASDTLSAFPVDLMKTTGPLSILIAEDNHINQKVAIQLLRKMGFNSVDIANDGQEAIDAITQKKYDLVFMDVNMPNMDGLTATKIICERVKNRPRIVAMTANAMRGDKDMCLEAGCDDYIAKPILIDELVNCLTDTGLFKRTMEEVSVDDASVPVLEAEVGMRVSSSSSLPSLIPQTADSSVTMVAGNKRTNSDSRDDVEMDESPGDEEKAARPTKVARRTKE
ncbi:hypothetical protein BC937DRAFT_90888 [Endogone sp. FLAS-F59071]|nr:hypothetical protein BC937DRAFT_90888 [Endogone sp. FLAS-F59071]|eukprot:RUS16711.1 hypothetical protein BC937DRAFT_90888 [Endogone sp. FLAS-F59071]